MLDFEEGRLDEVMSRNLTEDFLIQRWPLFDLIIVLFSHQLREFCLNGSISHVLTKISCQRPYNLVCNSAGLNFFLFHLRESNHQIQEQVLEISHLRKKIQQGREVSSLINDFLKHLITQEGPDCHKEHHLQELLAVGRRLAESLVCMLSSGNVARGPNYIECSKVPGSRDAPLPKLPFDQVFCFPCQTQDMVTSGLPAREHRSKLTNESHSSATMFFFPERMWPLDEEAASI